MKEKKKRVEDSVCKFCRRPVGLARAFARGPEGVACLGHPGVLEIWLRDGSSPTLFIKRADPTTRDGKWLTVDVPSFLKSKNLLPGSNNDANRALKSLVFNVAGGAPEDSPRPAGLALEVKHSDTSSSPSLDREKGKGGVGGGWGLSQAFESEAEPSHSRPQKKDPRDNLFRDLIEDERAQLQKKRRRQLKTKGLRAAAMEGSR